MFKWRDAYSVNVGAIDEQHKILFKIGRELGDIVSIEGDHFDEIMAILNKLKDYTVFHFNEEEEMMEKYGYPEIEKHRLEHKFFVNKINELDKEDEVDEEQKKITMEIITFIANWIENHILKTDQRYSKFFNDKGIY